MGGFLVITVSHPTFCCVVVEVRVEVGLGCDNRLVHCVYGMEIHHICSFRLL